MVRLHQTPLQPATLARIVDIITTKPLPESTALVNYRLQLPDGSHRWALRCEFSYVDELKAMRKPRRALGSRKLAEWVLAHA